VHEDMVKSKLVMSCNLVISNKTLCLPVEPNAQVTLVWLLQIINTISVTLDPKAAAISCRRKFQAMPALAV